MEAVAAQVFALIVINAVLFLIIGMVILDNPLKLGIMIAVFFANIAMFFGTALLTSDNPRLAIASLGAKMIPYVIVFVGFTLVLILQYNSTAKAHKVPRSSSRFIR